MEQGRFCISGRLSWDFALFIIKLAKIVLQFSKQFFKNKAIYNNDLLLSQRYDFIPRNLEKTTHAYVQIIASYLPKLVASKSSPLRHHHYIIIIPANKMFYFAVVKPIHFLYCFSYSDQLINNTNVFLHLDIAEKFKNEETKDNIY